MPNTSILVADLTPSIRQILQGYGKESLFKEILQNSDDAGATEQKFIIDRRTHPHATVLDPILKETQGPSLICYNNSIFRKETDWAALRKLNHSSKEDDESKVGKFGIGFKTVYHITDNPHILSDDNLMVLDPHSNLFNDSSIIEESLENLRELYSDQLVAFNSIGELDSAGNSFGGTIVRLPLRTREQANVTRIVPVDSENASVSADDIRQLMDTFERELGHSMLFLRNVTTISLHEVDENGSRMFVAEARRVTVDEESGSGWTTSRVTVHVLLRGEISEVSQTWRLLHLHGEREEAAQEIHRRLNKDYSNSLKMNKLNPKVSLAVPVDGNQGGNQSFNGRLFTVLPLPIVTGLPLHVHGMFALSPDRASLKGSQSSVNQGQTADYLSTWNEILFEVFIARAWTELLSMLLEKNEIPNVYDFLPVKSQRTGNWSNLPRVVFELIKDKKIPIWLTDNGERLKLEDVLVVSIEDPHVNAINALKNANVKIARVPQHIFELLCEYDYGRRFSHATVREELLRLSNRGTSDFPPAVTSDDKRYLLDFFCYSAPFQFENFFSLPFIPSIIDDKYISITGSDSAQYIALDEDEAKVFRRFNRTFIALWKLPRVLVAIFRGPSQSWSRPICRTLLPSDVFACLDDLPGTVCERWSDIARLVVESREERVDWLQSFFQWVCRSTRADIIAILHDQRLRGLCVLPILGGDIIRPCIAALSSTSLQNHVKATLSKVGVPIITDRLSPEVQATLESAQILRSPYDLGYLLDSIEVDGVYELGSAETSLLQNFLTTVGRSYTSLTQDRRVKLRSLPVFITLRRGQNNETIRVCGRGPMGEQPVFVKAEMNNVVVPDSDDGEVFIDMTHSTNQVLAGLVEPTCYSSSKTDVEFLEWSVNRLENQSDFTVKIALVHRLLLRFNELSDGAKERFRSSRFITAADGSVQSPNRVVDLDGPLVGLYGENENAWPVGKFARHTPLYQLLRIYRLLLVDLTPEITKDRLQYVHDTGCQEKARALLKLLNKAQGGVVGRQDVVNRLRSRCWLPTLSRKGLVTASAARHDTDRYTFDKVLEIVEVKNNLLVIALGWNAPLSFDTVREQMRRTLDDWEDDSGIIRTKRIEDLIRYIAELRFAGVFTPQDVQTLREEIGDRPWIPIDGILFPTRLSLTSQRHVYAPFRNIPRNLCGEKHLGFLTGMGCSDRPSNDELLKELNSKVEGARDNDIDGTMGLLRELVGREDWTPGQRVMVPDDLRKSRSSNECHFADSMASTVSLSSQNKHRVHRSMGMDTAERLQIPFLSSLSVEGLDEDEDEEQMDVSLIDVIQTTLQDYQVNYAGNEFVANAVDAKAKRFVYMLDRRTWHVPSEELMSKAFADAYNRPALVLYNDACFTKENFHGIRKVARGSKHSQRDGIGRFGLGALSLFYFTDLVTVVSGEHILILDPTGTHLPRTRNHAQRTSMLMTLTNMRSKYPTTLSCLSGLFGFSSTNSTLFDGTVFRLPLRSGYSRSKLFGKHYNDSDVTKLVTEEYFNLASKSLFFTSIETIEAQQYPGHTLWSVKRNSTHAILGHFLDANDNCQALSLSLRLQPPQSHAFTQNWMVLRAYTDKDGVPSDHRDILERYRLPEQPRVAVAAQLDEDIRYLDPTHQLFSFLPLPVELNLPVHVDGSFALASDRRSIRLDSYNSVPESAYNLWLLTEPLIQAYTALLQLLGRVMIDRPKDVVHDQRWWPSARSSGMSSPCTEVTTAFYAALPSSKAKFCFVSSSGYQAPGDVVFSLGEPEDVTKLMDLLIPNSFFRLSPGVGVKDIRIFLQDCVPQQNQISPAKVAEVMRASAAKVCAVYAEGRIKVSTFDRILRYLLRGDVSAIGLPILVSADSSLNELGEARSFYAATKIPSSLDQRLIECLGPEKFVHDLYSSEVMAKLVEVVGSGIKFITKFEFIQIIKKRIAPAQMALLKQKDALWLDEVVALVSLLTQSLEMSLADIEDLPLVQLGLIGPKDIGKKETSHISLSYCRDGPVLTDPAQQRRSIFLKLGLYIISPDNRIKRHLESMRAMVQPNLSNTLHRLMQVERYEARFRSLPAEDKRTMQKWVRERLSGLTQVLLQALSKLDLWDAQQRDELISFYSAEKITVLPSGVHLAVFSRYLNYGIVYAEHDYSLAHLVTKVCPRKLIEKSDLPAILHLPSTLPTDQDMQTYRKVYDYLLANHGGRISQFKVPNQRRQLVLPQTLYSHETEIFVSCLGSGQPELFLHESFQDLERRLSASDGTMLKCELTPDTLHVCAEAIDRGFDPESDNGDTIRTAQQLFHLCNTERSFLLPITEASWSRNSRLRFIPRLEQRMRSVPDGFVPSNCAYELPAIVCPTELVRKEYEDIAWTQYAIFSEQPSQALLRCLPELGVPTLDKVVGHLIVLVEHVYRDNQRESHFHDLQSTLYTQLIATYKWLNNRADDFRRHVKGSHPDFGQRTLFLNVDSIQSKWRFISANQLCFGQTRDAANGRLFSPRLSLLPFKKLLLGCGASVVDPFVAARRSKTVSGDNIRPVFNEMRQNGAFVDIVLMPSHGVDNGSTYNLAGHRALLAACIPHVRDTLTAGMQENKPTPTDGLYRIHYDYSAFTLSMVLDCVYASCDYLKSFTIDVDSQEMKDRLDDLLEIIRASDYFSLPELMDAAKLAIERNNLVQLETCEYIYESIGDLPIAQSFRTEIKKWIEVHREQLDNLVPDSSDTSDENDDEDDDGDLSD